MTKLEQIEKSILELSPDELRAFTDWFEEMMERSFDDAIERDGFEVPVRMDGRAPFDRSLGGDVVSGHHHVW